MLQIVSQRILLVILRWLSPEAAHHLAIRFLKILQFTLRLGFRPAVGESAYVLTFKGPPLHFPSRVGLAAGFDKNAEVFAGLSLLGFGFVEVGTVTLLPQAGNPKPRLWRTPNFSLVNQMGFNNCGVDVFKRNLARYKSRVQVPVLVNIGKGKDTRDALEDYRRLFLELAEFADAFVVNISSPNTPGLRNLQNVDFLKNLESLCPSEKSIFIKLAPDLPDAELAQLCSFVGKSDIFAGAVITNTSTALAQEMCGKSGGLSGRPLFSRALTCVRIARQELPKEKTLIGVGGIFQGIDARRMVEAGADLIEIYTAFVYRGKEAIDDIKSALSNL